MGADWGEISKERAYKCGTTLAAEMLSNHLALARNLPLSLASAIDPYPGVTPILIEHGPVTPVASAIPHGAGATTEHADAVAAHLVEVNLKGHDSHGVGVVIPREKLKLNVWPRAPKSTPTAGNPC